MEDFSAATHFTRRLAKKTLANYLPFDADVIKLEIHRGATPENRLVVTRQDQLSYNQSIMEPRENLIGTKLKVTLIPSKGEYTRTDTDAYALAKGCVSITPLSLDFNSRICLTEIANIFNSETLTKES